MPSQMCSCRQVLDLSSIPVKRGLSIFSHAELIGSIGGLVKDISMLAASEPNEVNRLTYRRFGYSGNATHALQCDNCFRLLILNDDEDIAGIFTPEYTNECTQEKLPAVDLVQPRRE